MIVIPGATISVTDSQSGPGDAEPVVIRWRSAVASGDDRGRAVVGQPVDLDVREEMHERAGDGS